MYDIITGNFSDQKHIALVFWGTMFSRNKLNLYLKVPLYPVLCIEHVRYSYHHGTNTPGMNTVNKNLCSTPRVYVAACHGQVSFYLADNVVYNTYKTSLAYVHIFSFNMWNDDTVCGGKMHFPIKCFSSEYDSIHLKALIGIEQSRLAKIQSRWTRRIHLTFASWGFRKILISYHDPRIPRSPSQTQRISSLLF